MCSRGLETHVAREPADPARHHSLNAEALSCASSGDGKIVGASAPREGARPKGAALLQAHLLAGLALIVLSLVAFGLWGSPS